MEQEEGTFSQNDDRDYRRGDRRDRGGGRRRDRKPRERIRRDRPERAEIVDGGESQGNSMKAPIILAKKLQPDGPKKEAPTILAIQRRSIFRGYFAANTEECRREFRGLLISLTAEHHHVLTGLPALKLPAEIYPTESISLIDGSFQWSDKAFDVRNTKVKSTEESTDSMILQRIGFFFDRRNQSITLLDQTDYVVVGCVGLQGSGKSTVMSMLAGQQVDSLEKTTVDIAKALEQRRLTLLCLYLQTLNKFLPTGRLVFRPQKKADLEKCIHRTVGMDMFITHERMILLDTQPLLSPSMLDQYLRYDRKVPSEYSTAELCLEVQALQILSFLYTVCHVIVVVQDHFTDLNLLNLLKTAEMLKPSTVSHTTQDGTSVNAEDMNEYFPHIAFVYTCCEGRTFESNTVHSMCEILWKIFDTSRLRVRGSASIIRSPVLPYCQSPMFFDYQDLNLFLLPQMRHNSAGDEDSSPLSKYHGHPSLQTLVKILRQQLVAMPREPFTHHLLSEKNWFHFAARTWEAVKKSNLIAEYHRLLST